MAETLKLESRKNLGTSNAKRYRRDGKVPGIYYFHGQEVTPFTVDRKELSALLGQESSLIDVVFDGKTRKKCIIREIQLDPIDNSPLHLDLMGIMLTEKIHVSVPIHLLGTPTGVKNQGGIMQQVLRELEIECLPTEIPEHIDVDVSHLDIGGSVHLSELDLQSLKVVGDLHRVIATVSAPRITEEKPVEAEVSPAEPEVISKRPEKEEEEK